jgi:hypothetical protein
MTSKVGKTIVVVKPFTFSHAGTAAIRDPATNKITQHATPGYAKEFGVGPNGEAREHETTPEMIEHPWIMDGADGSIETEDQKQARTDQEAIDKAAADAQARVAATRAEQAKAKADRDARAAEKPAPAGK